MELCIGLCKQYYNQLNILSKKEICTVATKKVKKAKENEVFYKCINIFSIYIFKNG